MAYAFAGMFIYDSTHDYQNSSDLGMFYSIFVPFIVAISTSISNLFIQ